jgi:hypothetical protein
MKTGGFASIPAAPAGFPAPYDARHAAAAGTPLGWNRKPDHEEVTGTAQASRADLLGLRQILPR